MKISCLRCLALLPVLLCLSLPEIEAQSIEMGLVHEGCMWFTCYKSRRAVQVSTYGEIREEYYWDYIAEFNRTDEIGGHWDHKHYLPDFVELDGLRYRVTTAYHLPCDMPNRMMEELPFSAYNGLKELFIPEESCLEVEHLPDVERLMIKNTHWLNRKSQSLYAPHLRSVIMSDGKIMAKPYNIENLDNMERSILC